MYQAFSIAETFGIPAPAKFTVEGYSDPSHPRIPVKREYAFRKEHLRDVLAFLDRFRLIEIGYPKPTLEDSLLATAIPAIPAPIREKMIRVANEVRKLFVGGDEGPGMLSVTMSTRGLLRWASLTVAFKGAPNALEYALDRALTLRAEPEQRLAIHRIAADVFGDDWSGA